MRGLPPEEIDRPPTAQTRTPGGALAFAGLFVLGMFLVTYPVPTLGVILGLLLGAAFPRVAERIQRRTELPDRRRHAENRYSG